MSSQLKKRLLACAKYLVLSVAAFLSIFPFYWMFTGATNTSNAVAQGSLLPGSHFFENWQSVMARYDMGRILFNSVKIAVITVLFSLLVTSMAAFGFEKFKTRASGRVYSLILLSMMIPFAALMIPLFKMMSAAGLVNSHLAVILPALSSTFLIFFFCQNFKTFPTEILESARMDGCSNLRSFFTIVIPTMKSTYAAAAIYAFMTAWNSYMWPLVILQTDSQKTMTLLISGMAGASYVADYGAQMLVLVVGTIPMMLVFLLMQKQFVEGMTGSVKG